MDCIFCKIKNNQISSDKLYEDEKIFIIKDINPLSDIHCLIIPKEHFENIESATSKNLDLIRYILSKIKKIKDLLGLKEGYRLVINSGKNSGQEIDHLHIHILGGNKLDKFI